MKEISQTIIAIIKEIPPGKVLSYGEIARRAGHPATARLVSYLLHSSSEKHNLPWHRVINSQGKISLTGLGGEEQKQLLESEGVIFENGKTDLKKFTYQG
jgi:methylated-DNA-protein-cysteine methyltransferase-like protein